MTKQSVIYIVDAFSMEIYKYAGAYGIDILKSCELKVSDPREFNDPFEFCPQMVTQITREHIQEKLKDDGFLKSIFGRNKEIRGSCPTLDEFLASVEANPDRWISFFRERFADPNRFRPPNFAEIAATHLGVICFAQDCHNILMWSHYAECHRGMVIQFDDSALGANLEVVEYDENRAPYNPVLDVNGIEYLARVMRRKSHHWAYEAELRLLVPWELTQERKLRNTNAIRTLQFSPHTVRRVILGCVATADLEQQTREVLADKSLVHVRLQRMARDLRKYELHPVDP